MKYGNFVTTEDLTVSTDEINSFKEHLENTFRDHNVPMKLTETNIGSINVAIVFTAQNCVKAFRNGGDRLDGFNKLTFLLYKSKGYLETKAADGSLVKDFDNAPKHQYQIYACCNGKVKHYRKRNAERVNGPQSFMFGTEVKDFDYTELVRWLKRNLKKEQSVNTL